MLPMYYPLSYISVIVNHLKSFVMENYLIELKNAKPIGTGLSLFEIQDPNDSEEYHVFHVMQSENFLYVGGVCNTGFLYSAHMEKDNDFSLDWNLQELHDAIEAKLYDNEEIQGELI